MDVDKFRKSLEKNRYSFVYFDNSEDAAAYLEENIRGKTVGFGDSGTLQALGMQERLSLRNEVHNPMLATDKHDFLARGEKALSTQVYLTSVNAASETGELVNIDGTGNRVAASFFGHEKIYFVLGVNKVQPTLEKALWRARNVAAPQNARRLGYKTPCAVKADKCYDCSSPDRICNAMVIHMKKMKEVDMEIVLIGESLGL